MTMPGFTAVAEHVQNLLLLPLELSVVPNGEPFGLERVILQEMSNIKDFYK